MVLGEKDRPCIVDSLEKVPSVFGGIIYLNEGTGVVYIRTGYTGRLRDRKHIGKNG